MRGIYSVLKLKCYWRIQSKTRKTKQNILQFYKNACLWTLNEAIRIRRYTDPVCVFVFI